MLIVLPPRPAEAREDGRREVGPAGEQGGRLGAVNSSQGRWKVGGESECGECPIFIFFFSYACGAQPLFIGRVSKGFILL